MDLKPSPSPEPVPGIGNIETGTLVILAIVIAVCGIILWWWSRPLGGGKK
jgi:hypothetical protein